MLDFLSKSLRVEQTKSTRGKMFFMDQTKHKNTFVHLLNERNVT